MRLITRRQALIIGRFLERVNHIVQKAVVKAALIKVGLHFRELLFRPVKAFIFFFARPSSTPDMVKVGSYLRENLRPPLVAVVACIAIVVPVLRGSTHCECHHDQ